MITLPFLKQKYKAPANAEEFSYINNNIINKSIRTVAILACFSSNGEISELQKYYLDELNKNFDAVVMIFDCHIKRDSFYKIKDQVFYFEASRHEEYDFGSYKRGYEFLIKNKIIDSLYKVLLINDSCYGPIFPLKNVYEKMSFKTDFWGMIKNDKYDTHIQSWFISFERNVIKSGLIYEFLKEVKKHKLQHTFVMKYETKFTKFLTNRGFTFDTYLPTNFKIKKFGVAGNMSFFSEQIIKSFKFPFMKKKLFDPYFYHIVDERKGAMKQIEKYNPKLYKLIINDLKSKNYDMSFLD